MKIIATVIEWFYENYGIYVAIAPWGGLWEIRCHLVDYKKYNLKNRLTFPASYFDDRNNGFNEFMLAVVNNMLSHYEKPV